jgi:hypothetical protein
MKAKLKRSLKFALKQREIAKNKFIEYGTGHWVDKNEEKRVLDHAEMMRYEAANSIIIWDWIIGTLQETLGIREPQSKPVKIP